LLIDKIGDEANHYADDQRIMTQWKGRGVQSQGCNGLVIASGGPIGDAHIIKGFQNEEIKQWCLKNIYPGSTVVSDGLQCFDAVVDAKCIHETHIVGGGKKAAEHPSFKWVNTIPSNVKNSLTGTYHAFAQKLVPKVSCRISIYQV
jgi:hypothetical protein